jgi:site-specific DNA recombinase
MARAGEFEVLVVREIDRLSRNLAKQLIVEEELKRAGVRIDYVLGDYPDTPEGNLQKNIKASIAEYERLKIAERNTRGRRQKVRAGHVITHGRTPYGYRKVEVNGKSALVIHEPEAEVIRSIYTWYTRGDGEQGPMSIYAISERLTELEVPTHGDKPDSLVKKQNPRGKWARSTVWRMLQNETYAGTWYYSKAKRVDGVTVRNAKENWLSVEVPAIVDRVVWKEAQSRRQSNLKRSPRNTRHQYLLRRRVTCGMCSTKMFCRSGPGEYAYYSCPVVNDRDRLKECSAKYFRVDQVDPAIWNWIKALLSDPDELAAGLRRFEADNERDCKPLRERLGVVGNLMEENQSQLTRLLDLYLEGSFPKEALIERKNRLESTIEALEQEHSAMVAQLQARILSQDQIQGIQQFAAEIAEGLEVADSQFEARRRLIEMLDVQVTLVEEDGTKVAYARCALDLDDSHLSIAPQSS